MKSLFVIPLVGILPREAAPWPDPRSQPRTAAATASAVTFDSRMPLRW